MGAGPADHRPRPTSEAAPRRRRPRSTLGTVADDLRALRGPRSAAAGWSTSTTSSGWPPATWRADPVYAAARRWRFRHLFVDEFQDVNPLQFDAAAARGSGPSPTCASSATRTRPSTPGTAPTPATCTDFDRSSPAATRSTLEDNYRSTPQILGVANAVLDAGTHVPLRLRPHRPATARCPPSARYADETAEARAIARRCRDRHAPGRPWSRQAVLVRTNAQLAGPRRRRSPRRRSPTGSAAAATCWSSPRCAGRVLQLAADRGDLGRAAAERLDDLEPTPSSTAERRPCRRRRGSPTNVRANLAELVRLGPRVPRPRSHGAAGALRGVAHLDAAQRGPRRRRRRRDRHLPRRQGPGVAGRARRRASRRASCPSTTPRRDDDLDEERRLLYVALTRAERRAALHLGGTPGLRLAVAEPPPSPWLETDRARRRAAERRRRAGRPRGRGRRRRATPARHEGSRPARRRPWREGDARPRTRRPTAVRRAAGVALGAGRGADVPAFVIFNDATLVEVADARPATRGRSCSTSRASARSRPSASATTCSRIVADEARPDGRHRVQPLLAEVARAAPGTSRGRRR